ncbi:hypothetical protein EMCRGX_G033547 [Ephydatia muelleri]
MSTNSYAISSASESQDAEMGETMVLEGPIKYKSWVWEHFTCVASKTKRKYWSGGRRTCRTGSDAHETVPRHCVLIAHCPSNVIDVIGNFGYGVRVGETGELRRHN